MQRDCCITDGNNWFRYRAAGIVIEDGKLLMITSEQVDYYYTVGGGVHMGEKAEDCVRREMKEETGIDYETDHLAVVCENFFRGDGWVIDGMDCHCLEFYFVMKSRGITDIVSGSTAADGSREELAWIPIDRIQEYNIKPTVLKDRIGDIINGGPIIHIVTEVDRK